MKQSFSWWAFARNGMEPNTLCKAAKSLGCAGVDLAPEDQWARILDNGLEVASISGHASLTDGLNRKSNHDRIEAEIATNIEKAVAIGKPNLVCFSGNRGDISDEEGLENTALGLRRVAPLAEAAGVTLVMELLNSKVDHKDYQCDRTLWGARVCAAVGSMRVRLLYDIYHMQIQEGDLIRTIRTHADAIGHYHTAGNPGRRDLDGTMQEIHYPAVMKAIAETGFTGWVGHEFMPSGDPIESLKNAVRLCRVS
jgi:hydroxypyruvate isomerase